jgi:deoxyribonuclease V
MKNLHKWNISYERARQIQQKLAQKVRFTPIKGEINRIGGLDCAFSKDKKYIAAVAVILTYPELETIETNQAVKKVNFPYIPGLLSFREAPACLAAVEKVKNQPDVWMIDGQGIAHPRRLGLASHLGLFIDQPTIGCAKSRLTGEYKPPGTEKSSRTPLVDKKSKEVIGTVLRTRTNVKPLFISAGHKITLEQSVELVLKSAPKYRIPEPTRRAHITVTKLKPRIKTSKTAK